MQEKEWVLEPQKDLPDQALPEARSLFNFPYTGAREAP